MNHLIRKIMHVNQTTTIPENVPKYSTYIHTSKVNDKSFSCVGYKICDSGNVVFIDELDKVLRTNKYSKKEKI